MTPRASGEAHPHRPPHRACGGRAPFLLRGAAMKRFLPSAALLCALAAGCAPAATRPSPPANVFPGFDTSIYPGDDAMRSWRRESPYRWVGYYLPSPCRRDGSWSGRRAALEGMGWGFAVLYVGQQAFEDAADTLPRAAGPVLCSRTLLSPAQGRIDARDAVARAAAEGFARGSVVFLDVERMRVVPDSMLAYHAAWTEEVLRDGSYLPGTYAHQANAARLFASAREVYARAGRTESPPFWIAGGSGFSLDQPPYAVGVVYARVWQGALDVQRTWGGVRLLVDENVADRPSPSVPPVR